VTEDLGARRKCGVDAGKEVGGFDFKPFRARPTGRVFVELAQVVDPVATFEFDAVCVAAKAVDPIFPVRPGIRAAVTEALIVVRASPDTGDWIARAFFAHDPGDRSTFGKLYVEASDFLVPGDRH
jgi:hypothetical protein